MVSRKAIDLRAPAIVDDGIKASQTHFRDFEYVLISTLGLFRHYGRTRG